MCFMQSKSLEEEITMLFVDPFNRPKKKPMHETAIQIALEERYDHKQISYVLRQLVARKFLGSIRLKISKVGYARFFFIKTNSPEKNKGELRKKILRYSYWIQRYSNQSITKMIGNHLHALVRAELRAQGFEIVSEFSNKYNGKKWSCKETLDIIAEHRKNQLAIGLEIKNMLSLISNVEVSTKIEMCNFFGIKPVFACRWIEPYRQIITQNGGFVWQFKKQFYPLGQEKFVKELRKRFNFPIEVRSEIPLNNVMEFQKWIKI